MSSSTAERIAGIGGIALVVSLFLPWYAVEITVEGLTAGENSSGWDSLAVIDVVLAALGLVVIIVVAALDVGRLPDRLSGPAADLLLVVGAVTAALVLLRIADVPSLGESGPGVEVVREIGLFVAGLASTAIGFGGYASRPDS